MAVAHSRAVASLGLHSRQLTVLTRGGRIRAKRTAASGHIDRPKHSRAFLVGIITQVIRLARHSDLQTLQQLELRAGAQFRDLGMDAVADDEPPSIGSLTAFQQDGRAWVVVDENDGAVAYLLVAVIDGDAHIEQVSVHPGWARRRLGSDLIETAAEWGRANTLSALTLTTFHHVPWNRPYYERLGFEVVDDHDLTPGLREIRAGEIERGLDLWPRVAMRRPISSQSPATETDRRL